MGFWQPLTTPRMCTGRVFGFMSRPGFERKKTTYIIDENFHPQNEEAIYKLYVSIPEAEEERLTLKETLGHLRFEKEYLMFQPDAKKEGILRMLSYAGGRPRDVVVFGDDYNDLVMFDKEFYCVAMGNGCQELKDRADYVAASNVEDGIYRACEAHGWF